MNGLHSLQREVSGMSSKKNKRRASDTDLSSSSGSSASKKRRVVSAEKSCSKKSILSYFSPLSKSSSNLSNQVGERLEDSPVQHVVVGKQLNFESVIVIDSDEEIEQNIVSISRSTTEVRVMSSTSSGVKFREAEACGTINNNDSNSEPLVDNSTVHNVLLKDEQPLEQTQVISYDESENVEDSARLTSVDSSSQLGGSSDIIESDTGKKSLPSYYMRNFFLIIDTIIDKDKHLFNEHEWQLINALKTAPDHTQRLYIRLFYRKGPWFQETKLETTYREIPDIVSPRNEMQSRGLAMSIDSASNSFTDSDVIDLASMLTTGQLAQLLKSHTAGQQKVKRKDELLTALESSLKVKSQSTLFNYVTSPPTSRVAHWMRLIIALTGPCLK